MKVHVGNILRERDHGHGNRSQRGADGRAVFISIHRIVNQRGHDPLATITHALAEYLTTGKRPHAATRTSDG